jgi:mannose-1-phosphate guanylyltransferase
MREKAGIFFLLMSWCAYMNGNDIYNNVYGVVLAGGVGERLWPLSRSHHPKQFLSIDAQKTLLDQAIERLNQVISPQHIWLMVSAQHVHKVNPSTHGSLLFESAMRNTGPAILNACLALYKQNPDAVVLFVPADSYIPTTDYELFAHYVKQVLHFVAQHDGIALLGVKPAYSATGYGYIEYEQDAMMGLHKVVRFHEKPSERLASFYMKMPHMLWNICMFAGKVSVFIEEYQRVAPELYADVIAWQQGKKAYKDIINISIDYAVMERSNRVWVLPVDFAWCDVGNVDIFLAMKQKMQPNESLVVAVESNNNLIDVPSKMVALVGVDDLCVVETADALLITKRSEVEKVRQVVAQLKKNNQTSYL